MTGLDFELDVFVLNPFCFRVATFFVGCPFLALCVLGLPLFY
jgi:hypothetical protein